MLALRHAPVLLALLIGATGSAAAQQSSSDSARSEIRRTLRAFYFNLARGDWEAMTADILAAKVLAHRSPPETMMMSGGGAAEPRNDRATCAGAANTFVDVATIELDADWAEVRVPRCGFQSGADQFRLIRFEGRWRFVHIKLEQESPPPAPAGLSAPGRSR